ncbi:MAG TPA: preprotein translocase subunit YajC [Clostridiales bacterium]|nr:preprotein translocase subunit YajC [Clostridiales bacterium]
MGSLLLSSILPFALIILVMYFMLIRPQRKKEKTLRDQINNMKIGDEITTIGGIMGKIVSIKDDEVTIETSIERTKLQMNKYAIKDIKQYEQA